ncbi:efflux RND transporter periplasmic adaptor subunit [Luteimonas sp. BDR2-5]|uniref:efflux RND transporter periplasmic adaptor subunit n=1 Tax=Proluteimonas luteida TaxID=2878685 RepID=UPI001E38FD80|nr:efflux RND transporter periplasmic adaptor subunit [Luteimonas sp. BDR2-5]MCD9027172.1 efflux RND transporter periplasmic adaptor subunit [Luteimonas sp. BDR2-5]
MNTNADLLKELRIDRSAPPPPSRRGLWIGLGIAAGVLVLLALGFLLLGDRAITVDSAVAAAPSSGAAGGSVLDASGYVVARRMATVSAKITGRVREVRIEEGQQVEEGEIMATLDPIDADARRDLSAAQLEAARSQVAGVQAQLVEAEANAQRLQALVGRQLVSKAQYDQAIAQRDALRAQLATARRNTTVASEQLRISGIGVDDTFVRAPFAGVVVAKAAQPGEIVSPLSAGGGFTRTGIGTIVDMDSLEVEVDVGESYIGRVAPGMPVETTLNAYQDWKIPGSVIAIVPTADRGKATVKVRIALDAKDARIVPDMGATVSFLEQARPAGDADAPRHVRVPATALARRDGAQVVFVVDGDLARQRVVQAGERIGGNVEIQQGVTAGDEVVIDPPDALRDGSRIRLAD